ncbi:hypothetical protein AMTRI_Chr09g42450 [Amborella trichopoda]
MLFVFGIGFSWFVPGIGVYVLRIGFPLSWDRGVCPLNGHSPVLWDRVYVAFVLRIGFSWNSLVPGIGVCPWNGLLLELACLWNGLLLKLACPWLLGTRLSLE